MRLLGALFALFSTGCASMQPVARGSLDSGQQIQVSARSGFSFTVGTGADDDPPPCRMARVVGRTTRVTADTLFFGPDVLVTPVAGSDSYCRGGLRGFVLTNQPDLEIAAPRFDGARTRTFVLGAGIVVAVVWMMLWEEPVINASLVQP